MLLGVHWPMLRRESTSCVEGKRTSRCHTRCGPTCYKLSVSIRCSCSVRNVLPAAPLQSVGMDYFGFICLMLMLMLSGTVKQGEKTCCWQRKLAHCKITSSNLVVRPPASYETPAAQPVGPWHAPPLAAPIFLACLVVCERQFFHCVWVGLHKQRICEHMVYTRFGRKSPYNT